MSGILVVKEVEPAAVRTDFSNLMMRVTDNWKVKIPSFLSLYCERLRLTSYTKDLTTSLSDLVDYAQFYIAP